MARAVIRAHGGLLHRAVRRREHQVFVLGEGAAGDDGRSVLALVERHEVDDRGAAGRALANRQLVDLEAIDLTLVREEQHIVMRARDEEVLDEVLVLEAHSLDALAAALLGTVGGNRGALHVAGVCHGNDHVLVGDEVLDVELLGALDGNLGTALIGELALDLAHLVLDDGEDLLRVGKQVLVVGDRLAKAVELLLDLIAGETRKATETHLENGLGLLRREAKALDKALGSLGVGLRRADDVNDFVDVVESHEIALENVGTSLRLLEVEAGAAGHHVDLVVDIVLQHLAKRQELGHAIHERQVDYAEGGLELGELIQVIEDDLRDDILLELDDETNALLVRLVTEV